MRTTANLLAAPFMRVAGQLSIFCPAHTSNSFISDGDVQTNRINEDFFLLYNRV